MGRLGCTFTGGRTGEEVGRSGDWEVGRWGGEVARWRGVEEGIRDGKAGRWGEEAGSAPSEGRGIASRLCSLNLQLSVAHLRLLLPQRLRAPRPMSVRLVDPLLILWYHLPSFLNGEVRWGGGEVEWW